MTNPILDKAKSAILAKVDPRLQPTIQKIVSAGEAIMYSEQTRHMFIAAIKQTDAAKIGASFAGLAILTFKQAGKELPMKALIPAATILLCEGLQFMEDSGSVKVDSEFLAMSAKAMGEKLLELLKSTPDKLQGMVNQTKGSQQPAQTDQASAPGIVAGAQGAM